MEWFSSVWHWLILGFILLIGEVVLPGVFLMWWGFAAVIPALLLALFPAFSVTTLALIYAFGAIILSLIMWKYQHSRDRAEHSDLNRRDHAMVGARGSVEEITANGIGRGRFGDTTWRIRGENLRVGDAVEVLDADGITLLVRKID